MTYFEDFLRLVEGVDYKMIVHFIHEYIRFVSFLLNISIQ